jgi:hypothetical protein
MYQLLELREMSHVPFLFKPVCNISLTYETKGLFVYFSLSSSASSLIFFSLPSKQGPALLRPELTGAGLDDAGG